MLVALAALLAAPAAHAGSISTAGVVGGIDGSAAVGNVAAIHWNPAAIATVPGVRGMVDGTAMFVRVDATATRNGGIDPNTGAPYETAKARVTVPNAFLGATWQVVPDRLTLGLGVTDAFVGGADYAASEAPNGGDPEPPFTGHQRYHAVQTSIITAQIRPAVGVTVVEGLHLGGSLGIQYNMLNALTSSDILGTEGLDPAEVAAGTNDNPYAYDSVLEGEARGWSLGWSAGIFFDKFKKAQVGFSWDHAARFTATGDGTVTVPAALATTGERLPVNAKISFDQTMPDVARLFVNSQVNKKLNLGAGVEYQMWNVCCGGPDGDLEIGVTNQQGNAIGPDDGVSTSISPTQYNPRRLWNSANIHALAGFKPARKWWTGIRLSYNQNAVPDYAVSPANLDFESWGGVLGARYKMGKDDRFIVGLNYTKYFLTTREITTSAWNLQDGDSRYSPSLPYKTSANGTYSGATDGINLRLAFNFK
jgi:long-subunit fatty acid transport protein